MSLMRMNMRSQMSKGGVLSLLSQEQNTGGKAPMEQKWVRNSAKRNSALPSFFSRTIFTNRCSFD